MNSRWRERGERLWPEEDESGVYLDAKLVAEGPAVTEETAPGCEAHPATELAVLKSHRGHSVVVSPMVCLLSLLPVDSVSHDGLRWRWAMKSIEIGGGWPPAGETSFVMPAKWDNGGEAAIRQPTPVRGDITRQKGRSINAPC